MNNLLFKILKKTLGKILWHGTIIGEKISPQKTPCIFVSNHLGSYGPIAVLCGFPIRVYPWVISNVMNFKQAPEYLKMDFVDKELKLKHPLNIILSYIIGIICVFLMKFLNAIPVYKNSKSIKYTFNKSLSFLKDGKFLVIFPENSKKYNDFINDFDTGFIKIAKLYYENTGEILKFIPVTVHKEKSIIHIGKSIKYNPNLNFRQEKKRIKLYLLTQISKKYSHIENNFILK